MKTPTMIAISIASLWSFDALSAQTIDKRLALPANGTVEISIVSGSLQVRGGSQNDVHISGTISDESKFESSVEGERVIIKVEPPHHSSEKNQTTDIVVELPAKAKLIASTVSASTSIKGVQGAQQLQTVSGDITTEAQGEDLHLGTVSGSVEARGNGSPTHTTLNSVSGDVKLSNIGGFIDANTVSGGMALQLTSVTSGKLRTTSGDVELSGSLAHDARIDIESTSGDVTFKIAGQRDAEYALSSFSGDISACFGSVQPVKKNKYGPGEELRFTEGKGSARVSVNSMSGDIKLCN